MDPTQERSDEVKVLPGLEIKFYQLFLIQLRFPVLIRMVTADAAYFSFDKEKIFVDSREDGHQRLQ